MASNNTSPAGFLTLFHGRHTPVPKGLQFSFAGAVFQVRPKTWYCTVRRGYMCTLDGYLVELRSRVQKKNEKGLCDRGVLYLAGGMPPVHPRTAMTGTAPFPSKRVGEWGILESASRLLGGLGPKSLCTKNGPTRSFFPRWSLWSGGGGGALLLLCDDCDVTRCQVAPSATFCQPEHSS